MGVEIADKREDLLSESGAPASAASPAEATTAAPADSELKDAKLRVAEEAGGAAEVLAAAEPTHGGTLPGAVADGSGDDPLPTKNGGVAAAAAAAKPRVDEGAEKAVADPSAEDAPKFNFGEKKKKKAVDTTATSKGEFIDGAGQLFVRGHVYPYEELLTRIQAMINANNPDLTGSKRYTIKPPQVVRVGSKKVAWINFKDLCNIMGRSMEHVHQFVLAELGTEGSIAGDGQLVLKGKYGPKNIESLLRKYITEYVTCSMCKSPNTTMERDCRARLFTQHCEACGANRSVNPIKNGFHALGRGERRKAKI